MGAVTAVTGRAFVTRPGVDIGRRGRRGRGSGIPLGFAVAAVTTATMEVRPARDVQMGWVRAFAVAVSITIV